MDPIIYNYGDLEGGILQLEEERAVLVTLATAARSVLGSWDDKSSLFGPDMERLRTALAALDSFYRSEEAR